MKPKLLLITRNYPYQSKGGETMFIKPEMPYLKKYFDVTVAPLYCDGPIVDDISEISINLALSKKIKNKQKFKSLFLIFLKIIFSKVLYREVYRSLKKGVFPDFRKLLGYSRLFLLTKNWAESSGRCRVYDLFYTYWSTGITSGIIESCKSNPIITRVHGYDIYHERQNGYIPGFDFNFKGVTKVFTISGHAQNYLQSFGISEEKIIVSRLGVKSREMSLKSNDDKLRVVSCSSLKPLKRVNSIYEALHIVAENHKNLTIEWTHLGGGELLSSLRNSLESTCPPNLEYNLAGQVSNEEVISYYKNNPVDIFVHASESEGIPVSMQEAASFGIPIITTNVGGISEVVTPENGILVNPENPSVNLANAIQEFIALSNEEKEAKRLAAQKHQRKLFNSKKNHAAFASRLSKMCQ